MSTVLIYPKNKQEEELILSFMEQNKIKNDILKKNEDVYVPFQSFANKLLKELDKSYKKKKKQ